VEDVPAVIGAHAGVGLEVGERSHSALGVGVDGRPGEDVGHRVVLAVARFIELMGCSRVAPGQIDREWFRLSAPSLSEQKLVQRCPTVAKIGRSRRIVW
jgi:hypothetical protein